MSETTQLELPLLQPSQAQKHVTVNEALAKLDGLTQLVLTSTTTSAPPATAPDGTAYGVPTGATGAWSGQAGRVAVWSNGGWVFSTPKLGWRGFVSDLGALAVYNGQDWVPGALAVGPNGASSQFHVVEFDHNLSAGPVSVPSEQIPQYAMVYAITGVVTSAITGTATAFEVGVSGASNRYGSGLSLGLAAWFVGITGQPVTYYSDTDIEIAAIGGDFSGGALRIALHYYLPTVPTI